MQPNNSTQAHFLSGRRYDIDAIRVLAFGLLILYHVGMYYVLEWDWHIKSDYQYAWLQSVMGFFNQWRMALLFVISGMATAILVHKSGQGFLAGRMRRLGLPLVFGMLVIVVPQAYFEAQANGVTTGNYTEFWWAYLTLQPWPDNAFSGSDPGYTWNHLWYLPYIMFYTLVLVTVRALLRRCSDKVSAKIPTGNLVYWIIAMVVVLMLCGYFIFPLFPYRSHALTDDWYTHSLFFSFFVFGYLLIRSDAIWQSLKEKRWWLLALAVVAFTGFSTMNAIVEPDSHFLMSFAQMLFIYLNRVSWILVILAFGYTLLNKPSEWLRYCNQAVFSWYILHQTVIVILGGILSAYQLGGLTEFALVLTGTLVLCLAIHHFLVLPLRFLHPVFGVPSSVKQPPEQLLTPRQAC